MKYVVVTLWVLLLTLPLRGQQYTIPTGAGPTAKEVGVTPQKTGITSVTGEKPTFTLPVIVDPLPNNGEPLGDVARRARAEKASKLKAKKVIEN